MNDRHHRIVRLAASTAAVAALAVTAAALAGAEEWGGTNSADPAVSARHRALGRLPDPNAVVPSSPTQRNDVAHYPRVRRAEPADTVLRNDNAHFGRQSSRTDGEPRAPIVVRVDGGFDWVSAGVGAAGGLGLVLVAGVAASTLRRRHRIDTARA